MNADPVMRFVWQLTMLLTWTGLGAAQAGTFFDRMAAPIDDPLLAAPPQLSAGKVLPGDDSAYECTSASSDPEGQLTLTHAIQVALCQSPQLKSAWATIKLQAAQLGESRAAYLPTLTIGASMQRQSTQLPESQFTLQSDRKSTSQFATLTWRLLDSGGRNANHRAAQSLLSAALTNHDAALQRMIATVTGLYFEAQTAKASHEGKISNEQLARQTWDIASALEARGVVSQSQTLQAKVALAKAELDRTRTLGAYEKAIVALQVTMGSPRSEWRPRNLTLAEDYDDSMTFLQQDLDAWLSAALEQHPALHVARFELGAAQDKLHVIQSEGLPTLDFTQSRYDNGRPNQALSSSRSKESVMGVTLNIPLFDGFSRTYKVRAAQAQIETKEAEISSVEGQVLGEIAKAYAEALAALRNLDSSKALLGASQDALSSITRKYERGVSDISEMLNVQAALADAKQERIRSLSEWRSARLRLLASAGLAGLKHVGTKQ